MKKLILAASLAAMAAILIPLRPQSVVRAANPDARVFLFRFTGDAADCSGSLTSGQATITGWQFDPRSDRVNGSSWTCATERQSYWDTPYERVMKGTSNREKLTEKGVLLTTAAANQTIRLSTKLGDFSFDTGDLKPGDSPRGLIPGRVTVQAMAASTLMTEDDRADDYPSLIEARDGSLWTAYTAFDGNADHVIARRMSNGVWAAPETLAGPGDYFRTAIAQDRNRRVWVVWSARDGANFDLWAAAHDGRRWSRPERLTTAANSDIYHSLAADAQGNLVLAWQSARAGNFDIYVRRFDGRWSPETKISDSDANDWEPSIAAAPDGSVTVVWDTYAAGNYDVVARTWRNGKWSAQQAIAGSGAFESRASARYDSRGRLWVAYDEGDWNWGKDYGNLIAESGRGLLVRRQARIAVVENSRILEPGVSPVTALPEDFRQAAQAPTLMLDRNDNPWLLFRARVNLPRAGGGRETYRAMWKMYATAWRGGAWSPAIEFTEGYGRIDMAAAMVSRRDGSVGAVWATDGRPWPLGMPARQDIRFTTLPGAPASNIGLKPFVTSSENLAPSHPNDAADVARVRAYRAKPGTSEYRIVRGDLHRHTDLSWDGNRDGSLDDAYRYALDAAAFDYMGVCDHQAGQSIPYHWWRIQKAVDLFTIQGRFAPVYSYERSLSWPNGHRNVFFATRGRPILEIPEAESRGKEGAAKLYEQLRRFNGLTSSHTSATGAGTDWRDSDPNVEPVVEIYQGYRTNYETPEGPRAARDGEATRFRAGFVQNAWAKGIKMGVQSSSDHVSTHISQGGFYVDRIERQAILDAMKARRSYASTDNMIIEIRMGDTFMGGELSAAAPPPLAVRVTGTQPIARVEVIRNNRIVHSLNDPGNAASFSWADTAPADGESWYYARAVQHDGQIVWSSPIWYRKNR